MKLLDGKITASSVLLDIAQEVEKIKSKGGRAPHLAAVLIGNDPASQTYVNAKINACKKVGFESTLVQKEASITQDELESIIMKLNNNDGLDGFIVQVPLPSHLNEERVTELIFPEKDVDGFHPINMGKLALELPCLQPATPKGIMLLLEKNGIDTVSKHVVVLGRSHTVGTPTAVLLSRKAKNATVTVCHSKTKDLQQHTLNADIIVAALGIPRFLKANMVKEGAVIVDVGIHRVEDDSKKSGFRLVGDVDFESVAPIASYITPVPGGVGPMTIAGLLHNTLLAYQMKIK